MGSLEDFTPRVPCPGLSLCGWAWAPQPSSGLSLSSSHTSAICPSLEPFLGCVHQQAAVCWPRTHGLGEPPKHSFPAPSAVPAGPWALGPPPGPLRVVPGSPPAPSLVSCLPQLRPLGWADPGPAGAQLCLLPLDHPLAFSRTSLLRPPLGNMFALLSEHTFVLSTVTGDWRALGYNCLPRAPAMLRVSLGDSHC